MKFFTDGTINATPCDKVTLKTVRGTYQTFTDKEKAEFAKRAAENGITATILPRVKNFATCRSLILNGLASYCLEKHP